MKIVFALILLSSASGFAETITGRIHSIEDGIIKFTNGRVAFFDSRSFDLKEKDIIRATLDEKSRLRSFQIIEENFKNTALIAEPVGQIYSTSRENYEPTIVAGGTQEAWNIYDRSNPFFKRISECSDRAHVWAFDEFKKNGTKSMKAFVFFTNSYINSARFKWWFHVAPMYKVNINGQVQNMVMDFRYTDGPKTIKEWTDHFVYTKRSCKVTTKFSEYEANPEKESCYLIFESMYYRLPVEISDQEKKGVYKIASPKSEINNSRRWAFEKEEELR